MNNIERLYKNIKILVDTNMLEEEFKVFAEENSDVETIEELNNVIETEISYWEE
ncbi:hypothetical protein [Crassaminicella thermophila]|uniref:hypothetical protein n=1 Tax=Crassaminicella thermophila TaxID=2599308 RepID=UPI00143DA28B|nr:hypothetical protein [Crassaminicella thermophila]